MSQHVKILFNVERDDETTEIESIWAIPEGDGYRLDNIPFYVRGFAFGDVVSVARDPDGALRCVGLVSASGHSTIRLWFSDAENVQAIRNELRRMKCNSELDLSRLVAVDVPPDIPYEIIKDYFDQKERLGIFEYEEGCLGQGVKTESSTHTPV